MTRTSQPEQSTVDPLRTASFAALGPVIRFGTYNLLNYRKFTTTEERVRCDRVVEVIRTLDADVLAVQEIHGVDRDAAIRNLTRLADDVGMHCTAAGQPVLANGGRGLYVGMLWWPDVPVVGAKMYDRPWFGSPLAKVVLDCGGRQHQLASHHASPFGRYGRVDETEEVVAAMTRPRLPGMLGHDANGISADRCSYRSSRRGEFYDPDPYHDSPWFPDLTYQCRWDDGKHWADRSAGEVFVRGGLHDAAAVLDKPWQATAGHWPSCEYGRHGIRRRIDIIRATDAMLPSLADLHVHLADLASTASDFPEHDESPRAVDPTTASDHLPVVVTYDPERINHGSA